MKNFLFLSLSLVLFSCASVDSVTKSPNCTVWRDQKYWGPYSVEVVANKVVWDTKCKSYNTECTALTVSMDENKNVSADNVVLGKIENNELRFAEKHPLTDKANFTGVRSYPEQKIVKSSIIENNVTTEESLQFNEKCSAEDSIIGAVALTTISKIQKK